MRGIAAQLDRDRGDIERTVCHWQDSGVPPGSVWLEMTRIYRDSIGWAEVTGYMLGVVAGERARVHYRKAA